MKKICFFLFIVLCVFSSCTFSFGDDEVEDAIGTLSLKIQSLVSSLSSDSSERAIIKADDVRLTLINSDSSEQVLESGSLTKSENKTKNTTTYKAKVKAGKGYQVKVDVFNTANGNEPVVSGTSETFDVISGKTANVAVFCIPISPEEKTVGETFDLTLTQKVEYWYSFIAESDVTEVSIKKKNFDASDIESVKYAIYDSDGKYALKTGSSSSASSSFKANSTKNPAKLSVSTSENSLYYIGICKAAGPELGITISISDKGTNGESSEPSDPQSTDDEGEGTISVTVQ